MPAIKVLMKPSSGMCNMKCDYCFYCDEVEKRKQSSYGFMSEETLKNIIRKTMVNAEGGVQFAYQGGEPTLRGLDFFKKAVEYQKKYNRKNLKVHNAFQTNGYLIDEEWCKFFAENHFLVGISIDGIREVHDAYRHDKNGHDTYERVVNAARLMDEYGVDYNILTVVNQKTVSYIDEIYDHYKKNGWNYQQYIACLEPLGEEHQMQEYALSAKRYGEFLTRLFRLWYKDWKKGKMPYIRQFDNYIGILLGYAPEACDQRGICGIQYVVEADGSVYPCDFYMLDEYKIGNFNTDRMAQMDEKRKEIGFLKRSRRLDESCTNCRFYKLCRGGCQRNRDLVEGTTDYKNYFCEGYQYFFENCMAQMIEVAKG